MSTPTYASNSGNAYRFGVGGTFTFSTIGTNLTYAIVEATLSHQFSEVDATANGAYVAVAAVNEMDSLSVTGLLYLGGSSPTQSALLAADITRPAPLGVVTIANAAAQINGDWNYAGKSDPYVDGQYARVSFTLHRKGSSSGLPAKMTAVS